jgi:hypothetical protein
MDENSNSGGFFHYLALLLVGGAFVMGLLFLIGSSPMAMSLSESVENLGGQDLNEALGNLAITSEQALLIEPKELSLDEIYANFFLFADKETWEENMDGLTLNGHPEVKHADYIEAIRKCFQNRSTWEGLIVLLNPDTKRIARICYLTDLGRFGIQIIEKVGDDWQEVTGFVKHKMTKLTQVLKYLYNRGYVQW